jgi:hypothetical protein
MLSAGRRDEVGHLSFSIYVDNNELPIATF